MNILVRIILKFFFQLFFNLLFYLATFSGNENPIALNSNSDGNLWTKLSQGPPNDGNKIYIFVNIIDNNDGVTIYTISKPIVVTSNENFLDELAANLASNNPSLPLLQELNSQNLNLIAKNVIAVAGELNFQSLSLNETKSNAQNTQKASLRDYLIGKLTDLSISDLSSMKIISSAMSIASSDREQVSVNAAVNFYIFMC